MRGYFPESEVVKGQEHMALEERLKAQGMLAQKTRAQGHCLQSGKEYGGGGGREQGAGVPNTGPNAPMP